MTLHDHDHDDDDDDDTTIEPTDDTDEDESVLLTESEPGSVLPPDDEPEDVDDVDGTDDDALDVEELDEAEDIDEDEPVDETDLVESDFAEVPEPTDDFDRAEVTEVPIVDEVVEPSPMERLEPVAADVPLDPGTGSVGDRWTTIQASFIDDPQRAVESASALVAQMWEDIERSIAVQQQSLEDGWQAGERSTDDLRVAMQEYRALYTRFVDFTP